MRVRLKDQLLVLTAETGDERQSLASWAGPVDGHVFALVLQDAQTVRLTSLGLRADACREPINVTSRAVDPAVRLISNLAHTPFELHGRSYASVEGFWQGLKDADGPRRMEVAALHGQEARLAGFDAPVAPVFAFLGGEIRSGTPDHWRLMRLACDAKFSQHAGARAALLATGERPLMHRTRKDSHTIPGVVMADIWMRVRTGLSHIAEAPADAGAEAAT